MDWCAPEENRTRFGGVHPLSLLHIVWKTVCFSVGLWYTDLLLAAGFFAFLIVRTEDFFSKKSP